MEAKAVGRYLRVMPRKAKFVLDTVRGKSANEALAMLKFIPNEAAKHIRQVLESAIANAENNLAMDRDTLRICRAYADTGPTMKRMQPRAMGRAYRILKRMSHITVVVTEDETLKKAAVKPKTRRTKETVEVAAAEPKTAKRKATKKEPEEAQKPSKTEEAAPAPEEIENVETVEITDSADEAAQNTMEEQKEE